MSDNKPTPMNSLMIFPLEKPILTNLVLMLIAVCFKLVDHFILRLDERLGEIILSRYLGFVLVISFAWLAGRKFKDVSFHSKNTEINPLNLSDGRCEPGGLTCIVGLKKRT